MAKQKDPKDVMRTSYCHSRPAEKNRKKLPVNPTIHISWKEKADDPEPPPEPVPDEEPDPPAHPITPAAAIPRPPFRPRKPVKMIGPYVGFLSQSSDYDRLGEELYEAGYNAASVFLTTAIGPWISPWKPMGSNFNFGVINPVWLNEYKKMSRAMAHWRITVHNKFVDQFHDFEDNPKPDPMRVGLKTGNEFDPKLLYESLDYDWDYVWISWEEEGAGKYKNYKLLTPFGHGMNLLVDTVIDVNKEMKDEFPDFFASWAWANECLAEYDPNTGKAKNIRGDRDEIHQWIDQKWKAAGFEVAKKYRSYFDYFMRTKGAPRTPHYPSMAEEQMWIYRRYYAFIEIHGIMGLEDVAKYDAAKFTDKHGTVYDFNKARTLFSTDGDLRMEADYVGLGKATNIPAVDLKLDNKRGQTPLGNDFMAYWDRYFPKYRTYVNPPA